MRANRPQYPRIAPNWDPKNKTSRRCYCLQSQSSRPASHKPSCWNGQICHVAFQA